MVSFAIIVRERWLAISIPVRSDSFSCSSFFCFMSRNPIASGSKYRRFLSFVVKYLQVFFISGFPFPFLRTQHTARSSPPAAFPIWIYTCSPFSGIQYAKFPISGRHGYQNALFGSCTQSMSNFTFTCSSFTSSTVAGSSRPVRCGFSF